MAKEKETIENFFAIGSTLIVVFCIAIFVDGVLPVRANVVNIKKDVEVSFCDIISYLYFEVLLDTFANIQQIKLIPGYEKRNKFFI